MAASAWERRIRRAEELIGERPFAAEFLQFYIRVARAQKELHFKLSKGARSADASFGRELSVVELSELTSNFGPFLSMAEHYGPKPLAELSRELRADKPAAWSELLSSAWSAHTQSDAQGFLALAFLQPYAELLRSHAKAAPSLHAYAVCPFCSRKPVVGVMRQMGDGAARSLVCAFCVNEWEFRRLVCPGCGEENDRKLPVFTASDFDYIRVEGCDVCKTYIKTVDLTKNGHAEPVVEDMVSAPLDLWAREQGYAKLEKNLLGM